MEYNKTRLQLLYYHKMENIQSMSYSQQYQSVRQHSIDICQPLQKEDFVVQPILDVSPPKWHLAHTTWFFETFILKPNMPTYVEFNPAYHFIFNSYYETMGPRVRRINRGALSRPTVDEIMAYRNHVDDAVSLFLSDPINEELIELLEIGMNHEQQHQELMIYDIKYILGNNPLFPVYKEQNVDDREYPFIQNEAIIIPEGIYEIGKGNESFGFDNEKKKHKIYLEKYAIDAQLITNEAYLQFILTGGYKDFRYWHSDAWEWLKTNDIQAPLYWHLVNDEWHEYTLSGLHPLILNRPVCHISFYEASAFAAWAGMRLPTEEEWEIASDKFNWGQRWEWTESAYLPYPGFKKAEGAIGEYNGKFMVNQMVLRGASVATPAGHSRKTYRNFFQAEIRHPFSGIRLAQTI